MDLSRWINPVSIARMSDRDFEIYWTALGRAIRLASLAQIAETPPSKEEVSTVSATTEVAWSPQQNHHPPAFGFRKAGG